MSNKRYAVLGYPLEHTLSPALHTKLFALSGEQAEYAAVSLAPDEFAARAEELFALKGFNITMPYKQRIIPYLTGMTEEAMFFGAVNTVAVRDWGRRIGHNTDIGGVQKSFEALGADFKSNICIAGAGATAGMLAGEIVRKGGSVTLAVRESSVEKAKGLAKSVHRFSLQPKVTVKPLASLREPFDLLINATPCGMYPNIEACPFPDEAVALSKRVFDLIYNPDETLLCAKARQMGIPVLNGLLMLVWQAALAHTFWYGAQFTNKQIHTIVDELRQTL